MIGGGTNVTAIIVFVAFVSLSLFITWWAAKKTHSAGEFYTAGGKITGFQNGLALAGDFMSAATFLGLTGLAFIGGADAMLYTVAITVSWAFILFAFADRMRNLGRYTFADVVAFRLHPERMRVLAAAGTLTVAIPYLIAQMVGAGSLIETLFNIPYLGSDCRYADDDICRVRRHAGDDVGPGNKGGFVAGWRDCATGVGSLEVRLQHRFAFPECQRRAPKGQRHISAGGSLQ